MGRRKEGQGEERGHLQRTGRHGRPTVGYPDIFVLRFTFDLKAMEARKVLDAGCGTGRNSSYLAGKGFQVVALDEAANKVREARDVAPQQEDILFVNGRLESLPFASSAFDGVACTHVLEYMDSERVQIALAELRRVLRRGGLLLLVVAAKEGANLEEAEDLGENDYLFRQGSVQVPIHLADKIELEDWLGAFRLRELARWSLEYPKPATVSGSWVVLARRGD